MAGVSPRRCAALAVLGALLAAAQPSALPSKRDAALRLLSPTDHVRVIVSTRAGDTNDVSDRLRKRGRAIFRTYSFINAIVTDATAEDLAALDADPDVT